MYSAIVMLLNQTPESFMPDYTEELHRQAGFGLFGPDPTIKRSGSRVDVIAHGIDFAVEFNIAESVAEEAKEIAEQFAADHPDRDKIARTDSRIEISSGDDPEFKASDSFVALIGAVEAIAPAWYFDPIEGQFL